MLRLYKKARSAERSETGRKTSAVQIFRIHTGKMMTNNMLDKGVSVEQMAELTENYSGAEIEAVVKNAASRALHEQLAGGKKEIVGSDVVVKMQHFLAAIDEIVPSFGNQGKEIRALLPTTYYELSDAHKICYEKTIGFLQASKNKRRLKTVLIAGPNGCGKTTLAMKIAFDSKIKHLKVIRAIDVVSLDESMRNYYIVDCVKNAYVSEDSVIIIDDAEIAINYANLGGIVFSNKLYQTLITILKTEPTMKDHRISIIVTCSDVEFKETLRKHFDLVLDVGDVGVKQLQVIGEQLGIDSWGEVDGVTVRDLLNKC